MMIKPSATSELIGYGRKKGGPDGRDLDHWQRAEEQHQETESEAETSPVAKDKGKKQPTHVLFVNNAP